MIDYNFMIKTFNRWQNSFLVHPYTCYNAHNLEIQFTEDGRGLVLVCDQCPDYKQLVDGELFKQLNNPKLIKYFDEMEPKFQNIVNKN